MSFKIAMVQMLVEGGDMQRNLAHAEELIAEAAENGADLALLPEAMDLAWTYPGCRDRAKPIPDGEPVIRGPYGDTAETIMYVDVDPLKRPARDCGRQKLWKSREEG